MGQDLRINRGADFEAIITLVGYTDFSYTAVCSIKRSARDADPVVECTITKILENPGCKFKISLTADQTLLLVTKGDSYANLERYVYDILIRNPNSKIVRILEGYIFVSPGVSYLEELLP